MSFSSFRVRHHSDGNETHDIVTGEFVAVHDKDLQENVLDVHVDYAELKGLVENRSKGVFLHR